MESTPKQRREHSLAEKPLSLSAIDFFVDFDYLNKYVLGER
jgi:hypothetical protein